MHVTTAKCGWPILNTVPECILCRQMLQIWNRLSENLPQTKVHKLFFLTERESIQIKSWGQSHLVYEPIIIRSDAKVERPPTLSVGCRGGTTSLFCNRSLMFCKTLCQVKSSDEKSQFRSESSPISNPVLNKLLFVLLLFCTAKHLPHLFT